MAFSLQRGKILSLVHIKPRTISELSKETGLGRTTIYHHLEYLKKNNLIFEDKQIKKQGQPVIIATTKADTFPLSIIKAIEKLTGYEKEMKKKSKK